MSSAKRKPAKAKAVTPPATKRGGKRPASAINPASGLAAPPASADAFVQLVTGSNRILTPEVTALNHSDFYNAVPGVRAIVGRIADGVARQQWWFTDLSDNKRVIKHPALDWLKFGNSRMRGYSAIKLTTILMDLQGECFWVIGRDGSGRPASYAPIPAHFVVTVPIGNEADGGAYTVRPRNGVTYQVPAADVLWFREPNPSDPYARGRGITGAMSSEISTDESASTYLQAFFSNYARPDLVVSGTKDQNLNADGMDRLKLQLDTEYRGAKKRGKTIVASSPLTIQAIGSSLKDNDVAGVRKSLNEVLRVTYGVSPEILGIVDSSNRSTIDAAQVIFATYVIEPRLKLIQEELGPFMEREFDISGKYTLEYENPVSEDRALKLTVMAADKLSFTKNEFRTLAGFEAVDEPGYDDYPVTPEAPVQPDIPPKGEPQGSQDGQTPGGKSKAVRNAKGRKVGVARKSLNAVDVVRISDAFDDPLVSANVAQLVQDVYERMIERYGAAALKEFNSEIKFQLNIEIAAWISANAPELLDQMDDTTRQDLQDALDEGVAAGEEVDALSARVDAVFAAAADVRSQTIADTVATQLMGFSTIAAGKQAGFDEKKWLTTGDTAVRKTHQQLDQKQIALGDEFVASDGARADHPGAFGDPAEDINCRCAIVLKLSSDEADKAWTEGRTKSFAAFHKRQHAKVSGSVKRSVKAVFAAQKKAVMTELQRAAGPK